MDFFNLKFDFESSSIKFDVECSDLDTNNEFKVYAHNEELLSDHLDKTNLVFNSLVSEDILDYFYKIFIKKEYIDVSKKEFRNIISDFVLCHDLGKISYNFQINRLKHDNLNIHSEQKMFINSNNFWEYVEKLAIPHSFTSSLVFLLKNKEIFEKNKLFLLILAYVINGHHTKLNDINSEKFFSYGLTNKEVMMNTFRLISLYTDNLTFDEIDNGFFQLSYFNKIQNEISDIIKFEGNKVESSLSFFYMYIYSLLVVSDIYASSKSSLSKDEFNSFNFNNRITDDLKFKMNNSFNDFQESLDNFKDINKLRKEMCDEASTNLINSLDSNHIFFLNMPTGAGKTITSMNLALNLINNTSVNRIIYSMPFINIIEQNYDVICNAFGLSEDNGEIRKIYSGSETIFPEENEEFKNNILLSDDFFNYPVICTTFVSLFNSVIKNNKKSKYKISALANSVIILDEIQSLPLNNWNSLYYIINELARNYNIYFIIMSATLPEFSKLKLDSNSNLRYDAVSLINNPSYYFEHELFKRTVIKNDISNFKLTTDENEECIKYLLSVIEDNFNQNYNKGLMVFNTIKSSNLVYNCLSNSEFVNKYGYEIDLLNSSLMPSTKNEIISKINKMRNDPNKKYILISTQSIEAGVDVSFDFIVRDFAIIDSIEQVRGRCNRSGELKNKKGNVYLIRLNNDKKCFYQYIYDEWEQLTRVVSTSELLNNINYSYEDIKEYYLKISNLINQNIDEYEENIIFNDRDNIKFLNTVEYSKLLDKETGIHVINNDREQFSIFIPINLEVMSESLGLIYYKQFDNCVFESLNSSEFKEFYSENKKEFKFTLDELKYIKEKSNDGVKLYENNVILAEKLLEYYKSIITNKNNKRNYSKYKILKEFSSILYKFIINISINSYEEIYSEIKRFKTIGFFYVLPKNKIGDESDSFYSLKTGFNYNPYICWID